MDVPYEFHETDSEEERKATYASDPQLAAAKTLWTLNKLERRANGAVISAQKLLDIVTTASSDPSLLEKIAGLKKFPTSEESEYIRYQMEDLKKRVEALECSRSEEGSRASRSSWASPRPTVTVLNDVWDQLLQSAQKRSEEQRRPSVAVLNGVWDALLQNTMNRLAKDSRRPSVGMLDDVWDVLMQSATNKHHAAESVETLMDDFWNQTLERVMFKEKSAQQPRASRRRRSTAEDLGDVWELLMQNTVTRSRRSPSRRQRPTDAMLTDVWDTMLQDAMSHPPESSVSKHRATKTMLSDVLNKMLQSTIEESEKKKIDMLEITQPLSDMYKGMTRAEIVLSLASEIQHLKKEYEMLLKNRSIIKESSSNITGEKAWNLLCKCMKEVDNIKCVLNTMTDGQFEKGIIQYVDPKRVEELEKKLDKTDNNLQRMEFILNKLNIFMQETDDMLGRCKPILEQLYMTELKEDTYSRDIQQAKEISDRITAMERSVKYMSNSTTLLLERLEGRIALLDATVKRMELLKELKADKEYVELILPDKVDKKIVQKAALFSELAKAHEEITRKLKYMIENIKKQMAMWNEVLAGFLDKTELKVKNRDFLNLLKEIEKRFKIFYKQLRNLEDGHRHEKSVRAENDRQIFNNMQCISCDKDAFMNNEIGLGVPIMEGFLRRSKVAPMLTRPLNSILRNFTEQVCNRNIFECCSLYSNIEGTCVYCQRVEKYPCLSAGSTAQESLVRVVELGDDNQGTQDNCNAEGVKEKEEVGTQVSLTKQQNTTK